MKNGVIIKVKNVSKFYSNLHVLDKINFKVKNKEFVSIIGHSGCGKTTLLKIIGGLLQPDEGTVLIENLPNQLALEKGKIGFVFQNPVLLPWRTVLKNIELPLEIKNVKNKISSRKLIKIIKLEGFENFYPFQLSGGMQQRVAIARALIFKPSILLMDEPFGSLDELTREELGLELLRLWERENSNLSTIIFVTHSIPEAVFLSDKVIVLSGRPAKVSKIIKINLPRPRKIKSIIRFTFPP